MSQSEHESQTPERRGGETRVDAAHVAYGGNEADFGPLVDAPALLASPAGLSNSLQQQAGQLAQHLRSQQQDLDRREAGLNSRMALLENEVRGARLWFDYRHDELDAERKALSGLGQSEDEDGKADESPGLDHPRDVGSSSDQGVSHELKARLAEREQELACREAELERQREAHTSFDAELEARHRELDRRQAELHVQIEKLAGDRAETERQTEFLALEREALSRQRKALDEQRREIANRSEAIARQATELEVGRGELSDRQSQCELEAQQLEQAEAGLAQRQREIETALRRFRDLDVREEQGAEETAYGKNLEQALETNARDQQELRRKCAEFEKERQAWERNCVCQRKDLKETRSQHQQELAVQKSRLMEKANDLEIRRQTIEAMADQLRAAQREHLETRLAIEAFWRQLCGSVSPSKVIPGLAAARAQLAEQYRTEKSVLEQRRRELQVTGRRLEKQRGRLKQRKEALARWADRQSLAISKKARQIDSQGKVLAQQRSESEARERSWQQERHAYQQELQRLRVLLGEKAQ